MKEIDMQVSDSDLGKDWFKNGHFGISAAISAIEYYNNIYGFNLYDNEEDFNNEQQLKKKIIIKYKYIVLPLMSVIEEMLKGYLVDYKYQNQYSNFERSRVVQSIVSANRSQGRGINGHNIEALLNQIESTDSNFKSTLINKYIQIRDKEMFNPFSPITKKIDPDKSSSDRLATATSDFKNLFVECRFLYETKERRGQNEIIDLAKLVQYAKAIELVLEEQLNKKHQKSNLAVGFDLIMYDKFDNYSKTNVEAQNIHKIR